MAGEEDSRELAGWYRGEADRMFLVTWSALGGYRVYDFTANSGRKLVSRGSDLFESRDADATSPRLLRIVRDSSGAVAGLRWANHADGQIGARRARGPYAQSEIRFSHGDTRLAGTLLIPRSGRPCPGAVFIHGSGDSHRDNIWYFAIADHLARNGVAVLLPDKRGCGASEGDWQAAGFDDYAGDALAGADAIRRSEGIDVRAIGVLGVSQGGHIAPMAARRDPRIAFAIALSGGAVPLAVQVAHEVEQNFRAAGAPEPAVQEGHELLRRAHAFIRTGSGWDAYIGQYTHLRAVDERAVSGFPSAPDDPYWSWWRRVIDIDPIEDWSQITVPGLIVFGEEDERDNVPVRACVARLEALLHQERSPGLTVRVFPSTGHGLFEAGSRRIRRDFLDLLVSWIHTHARGAG